MSRLLNAIQMCSQNERMLLPAQQPPLPQAPQLHIKRSPPRAQHPPFSFLGPSSTLRTTLTALSPHASRCHPSRLEGIRHPHHNIASYACAGFSCPATGFSPPHPPSSDGFSVIPRHIAPSSLFLRLEALHAAIAVIFTLPSQLRLPPLLPQDENMVVALTPPRIKTMRASTRTPMYSTSQWRDKETSDSPRTGAIEGARELFEDHHACHVRTLLNNQAKKENIRLAFLSDMQDPRIRFVSFSMDRNSPQDSTRES